MSLENQLKEKSRELQEMQNRFEQERSMSNSRFVGLYLSQSKDIIPRPVFKLSMTTVAHAK